jgi:prolyl-tRNA synthetase
MRMSQLFGQTLREAPADVEVEGHRLLLRSALVRQTGTGIFSYLPLGWRAIGKINSIIREEMDRIGGQEMLMPVVNPADLWKATGRWGAVGPELTRFTDRNDRDLVLAMTHEEAVSDLVKSEVQSYRHLPRLVYHIQTKWRDDPRPRAGLIRVREFIMKDSYSLDVDDAGLDIQYDRHFEAYLRIFARCGVPAVPVESDVGMMGGKGAHEFMYLAPIGEDTIIICPACGFRANRQVAAFGRPAPSTEEMLPVEEVATPDTPTIEGLAALLGIAASKTAKALFMIADDDGKGGGTLVLALVRGDLAVNETKLANAVKARELRPAREEEIVAAGGVPGYASPKGMHDLTIVADFSIRDGRNLVGGANRRGYHLTNLNFRRDYEADIVADIAAADSGYPCPECGAPLEARRGVELGNIFKLGTRYSDSVGATFLDEQGKARKVIMGSYGIGVGRLLACIAEDHHDEKGLIWPVSVAPFAVHLIALSGNENDGESLYAELVGAGIETFYDDRAERPGVMFNDADLMGFPIRLTVSKRATDAGGVEASVRSAGEREIVTRSGVVEWVKAKLTALAAEIETAVAETVDAATR